MTVTSPGLTDHPPLSAGLHYITVYVYRIASIHQPIVNEKKKEREKKNERTKERAREKKREKKRNRGREKEREISSKKRSYLAVCGGTTSILKIY